MSTDEKLKSAERVEDLFPDGVSPKRCEFDAMRGAWRIENGQAVLVGYRLHRGPNGEKAKVPGVLPQGEFDLQIVVALAAYLTYILRLSLDQACELIQFFWKLPIGRTPARRTERTGTQHNRIRNDPQKLAAIRSRFS